MRCWLLEIVAASVLFTAIPISLTEAQYSGQTLVDYMRIGTRVVRGKDWEWGNQDGGNGVIGTVYREPTRGWIKVKWDSGNFNLYRMGWNHKYDLNLADESATSPPATRNEAVPHANPAKQHSGRELASLMELGTRVVRGKDWEWGNQDGGDGVIGTVFGEIRRGWVRVKWDTGNSNRYRMGYNKKYDLDLAVLPPTTSTTSRPTTETALKKIERSSACPTKSVSGLQLASLLKVGSRVVRGQDWKWNSQDGGPGKEGRVTNTDTGDGWVYVEWDYGYLNKYRMGAEQSYDLQLACTEIEERM